MCQNLDSPVQYYWEMVETLGVAGGLRSVGGMLLKGIALLSPSFPLTPAMMQGMFCFAVSQQDVLPNHGTQSNKIK